MNWCAIWTACGAFTLGRCWETFKRDALIEGGPPMLACAIASFVFWPVVAFAHGYDCWQEKKEADRG